MCGGCLGSVYRVTDRHGDRRVAKIDDAATGILATEAKMLEFLREHTGLRVPEVVHVTPNVLVMEWLPGQTGCLEAAEAEAGLELARLHSHRADRFGFEFDTCIGGLSQPNPWTGSWIEFFAEHRLVHMARLAYDAHRIRQREVRCVERIARSLGDRLSEPDAPRLLHGDVWSGNVLSDAGRLTGFLDPALYYGHPEVELAFVTLFSTCGDRFFRSYESMTRRLDAEFWNERRNIYNIYPLLVHVCLHGGAYRADLNEMLDRYA